MVACFPWCDTQAFQPAQVGRSSAGQATDGPDLNRLHPKTIADHEQSGFRGAWFAHYRSTGSQGKRELVFLGTRHGIQLDSPSHRLIKDAITKFHPNCVVIEGSESRRGPNDPGLLRDARRMVSEGACPEPLYAAFLAAEHGIEFMGGEPPPSATTAALRTLGSDHDALGFLLVRELGQVLREEGSGELDSRVVRLLTRLRRRFQLNTDMDLDDFKNWFFEKTRHPFDAENLKFARTAPLDLPDPTFFERAAVQVMLAREKHLIEVEADLLARYRRILVVYGNGHLVYETPVLDHWLGKPIRTGTHW